jgi:TPR repeat protein
MKKIIILFSIFILSSLTSFAQSQYEQMQAIMTIVNSSELYLKNLQSQNNESDLKVLRGALQDIVDTKSNFDLNKFSNAIQVIISLAEKSDIASLLAGTIYEYNIAVKQDLNNAEKFYILAGENNAVAQLSLCKLYFRYGNDTMIQKGISICKKWMKDPQYKHNFQGILGEHLLYSKSKKDAMQGFELLCDCLKSKESPRTLVSIALAYSEGLGVETNPQKAVEHLLLAVKKFNDAEAKAILAMAYLTGNGVPENKPNIKEAERLAKEAYEAGYSDATIILEKIKTLKINQES